MKDTRLILLFKNNLLLKEIEKKYSSVAEFCRVKNLSDVIVGQYINFKLSPITKIKLKNSKPAMGGYYWKSSVLKIAAALKAEPSYLFPQQHWDEKKNKFQLELDSAEMISYNDNRYLEPLYENRIMEFDKNIILKLLATLTPREEAVIRARYGLNQTEKTFEQIAEMFNLSGERIRQIEAKALRKLRHPMRKKRLRNAV
jgi:RNA polymerase sigma factor (sigma-70 family)